MDFSPRTDLQHILSEKYGKKIFLDSIQPVGGGCINETGKVKTNQGNYFAKWNDAKRFPAMLEAEAKGLHLLKEAGEIKIPDVIAQHVAGNMQYLVLEWIESKGMKKDFWRDFGKSLSGLHRHSSEKFGLEYNNFIGSLPQSNGRHSAWTDFFILERLEPQLKLAQDSKNISNSVSRKFNQLFSRLDTIFPPEKPALLHGDLWSGNYIVGNTGEPVLIDPAVYYGHREMDIGMAKLFGGFDTGFYESYHEEFPLEKDWQKRTEISNLYPLLVHTNLFGGSYPRQVEDILQKFT
jgi:protein-ribulosamine 3-kinase